jgi:TP901 family phage tail tape measure protein
VSSKAMEAVILISGLMSDSVKKSVNDVNKQLGIIDNKTKATAAKLAAVSTAAATAVAGAAAAVVGYSVKVGASFEKAMSEVQAISGASGESLENLTEKAKEMGRTTAFSASEAAEAMKYMAMAGWKEQDIISGISGVMNLAAASGESLGSVSDIVTDAMTAFKMSSEQAEHFADVLAATSSSANTNVEMLGMSFKQSAALAGTMGYSIEDVSLALGLMANAGIKGETAGMAIKNSIANMASPTKSMAAVMDQLNLSLTDSNGNMKDFRTVLTEVRKGFSGLSKDEQAAAAATLFGKEAMAGMLSIVGASDADFNKLADAIDNSSGSAKKMADVMLDNLSGQFTMLKSVTEGIGISIYDKFKRPLTDALKSVTKNFEGLAKSLESGALSGGLDTLAKTISDALVGISNWLVDVLPTIINFTTNFIELISAVSGAIIDNWGWIEPVLMGIVGAFAAFKILTFINGLMAAWTPISTGAAVGTTALGAAVAFLTSPIFLIAAAIGAAIAVGILLWKNWDAIKVKALELWNYLGEAWSGIKETVVGYATQLGEWVSGVWTGIKDGAANMASGVVSFFTNAFTALPGILKSPINGAISLINGAVNAINGIGFTIPDWVPGIGGKAFSVNIPNIPMLAKGGFTNGVSIAGEAGTEAVISFDPAYRQQNIGYLAKAAEMLGVSDEMSINYYADKIASLEGSGLTAGGPMINYNLGGIIFSPTVTVSAGEKKVDIIEQLRNYQGDLLELIEDLLASKEAGNYGASRVF